MRYLLGFLLLCGAAVRGAPDEGPDRPRIGLVLSGGGARGLAHIGVLKVMEEAGLRPDVITGTSMGSIVGGLAALGYSAAEMESLVTTADWNTLLFDPLVRRELDMQQKREDDRYVLTLEAEDGALRLPGGLEAGQNVGKLFSRLTIPAHGVSSFSDLPIPFACIATDIATGEAVVLSSGDLGDAIRASMSLPTVFTPVTIDGRLLVDGGLVRNLPVEDARAMGAEYIIAVDVGSPAARPEDIRDLRQVLFQATGFIDAESRKRQHALSDLLIMASHPEFGLLDFDAAAALIRFGEERGRPYRALFDSLARAGRAAQEAPARRMPRDGDTLSITRVGFPGSVPADESALLAELDLRVPVRMTVAEVDASVERLYSSLEYATASYRLRTDGGDTTLLIRTTARGPNRVRLGFRFDTEENASILLNGTFGSVLLDRDRLLADLRLGERMTAGLRHLLPFGLRPGLGLRTDLRYEAYPVAYRAEGVTILSGTMHTGVFSLFGGSLFARLWEGGVGARLEYAELDPETDLFFRIVIERLVVGYATLRFDTFDRSVYPRSGFRAFAFADYIAGRSDGEVGIWRAGMAATGVVAIGPRTSVRLGGLLGAGFSDNMPVHYLFNLGGFRFPVAIPYTGQTFLSFQGARVQEVFGRQVHMALCALQHEVLPSVFLTGQVNAGNAFPESGLSFDRREYLWGAGISAGYLSLIGPLEATLMYGERNAVFGYLSVGFEF